AKAKKAVQQTETVEASEPETAKSAVNISDENGAENDPRKAAIAAAIARAKAKKAQRENMQQD
ncbi:hypothetical protein, partial [Aggregatibacter actinomycetemcomitans]